jgi:hypothetical protein
MNLGTGRGGSVSERDELMRELHASRLSALLRGHCWDVADVMAVADPYLEAMGVGLELVVDLEHEQPT